MRAKEEKKWMLFVRRSVDEGMRDGGRGERQERGTPGPKKRECSNLHKAMAEQVEGVDDDDSPRTIDELWADLDAADAAVAAFGPTPEQLREEAAEAERMASENGTPAKSAKVIGVLRRRWSDFLDVHGDAYKLTC